MHACRCKRRITVTTRKIAVFFYGLFMDMSLLHHRGLVPSHPQIACLDGYDIAIGDRATLVAHAEAQVYGVVISLTHMEIDTLYAEPSVADYRPEAVLVTLGNGCQVPALCYNLPQIVMGTQHNTAYALKLLELAQTLGFPRSYLDRLQGLAQ